MRNPTKVALKNLAETMVENDSYINTRGTGDFINEAVRLHKKTGSFVTVDTIKRHERELEEMCRLELQSRNVVEDKQMWHKLYDSEGFELEETEAIELISSEVILKKAREIITERNSALEVPVKEYSMFIEDEDGLRVIRGTYKGKYVADIDRENFVGCAAGWSKYQLNLNEQLGSDRKGALTEDDKNVFLDIMSNKVV